MTDSRAVVFGIDGTLVRASATHLECLAAAAGDVLATKATFTLVGETPYLNGHPVPGWTDAECFAALADEAGRDYAAVSDDLLVYYTGHYRRAVRNGASPGVLVPGVADLLDRLRAAGIPTVLSTGNASGIAQEKLTRLGIGDHFTYNPSLGFGDHHQDQATVVHAARTACGPATDVIMVGSTTADIVAASENGMRAVGVCTGAATARDLVEAGAATVLADAADLAGLLGLVDGPWSPRWVPGLPSTDNFWLSKP